MGKRQGLFPETMTYVFLLLVGTNFRPFLPPLLVFIEIACAQGKQPRTEQLFLLRVLMTTHALLYTD